MTLVLPRRRFLQCLTGLIAAPAIVRVANIMPVKALPVVDLPWWYCDRLPGLQYDHLATFKIEGEACAYDVDQLDISESALDRAEIEVLPYQRWQYVGSWRCVMTSSSRE